MTDWEAFFDMVEESEEPVAVVERRRREDDRIDEFVSLAMKHAQGGVTHRSIAEMMGMDRGVVFRGLQVLYDAHDWSEGEVS